MSHLFCLIVVSHLILMSLSFCIHSSMRPFMDQEKGFIFVPWKSSQLLMLLLPVVNGCLAEIHDYSSAWSPHCAKSILRNWYLGHVNVTSRSQVKKKDLNGQFMHPSPVMRLQTGTAELLILPSWKTNKQTQNQLPSGAVHVNAACGPVPKRGAQWFCWVPVFRHNFLSCSCHMYVIAVIQCQVSGISVCSTSAASEGNGILLWSKISPDFCCKQSTDRNLWAILLLTWVCSDAFEPLSQAPDLE